MEAKIISITNPLLEGKELTPEELLVYIARVSNPSNQANTETSERLLNYLIKHKHWSPFDMVDMTVEVKTSRAIAAQILRHWSFDFQEFSQRYAEAVEIEPIEIRKAGSTTRQGSAEEFDPEIKLLWSDGSIGVGQASEVIKNFIESAEVLYKALLAAGVAKECARMVLPLATQTTIYMKSSVRNWLFYFSQRLDPHAQKEHRELAELIFEIYKEKFPTVCKAFFNI